MSGFSVLCMHVHITFSEQIRRMEKYLSFPVGCHVISHDTGQDMLIKHRIVWLCPCVLLCIIMCDRRI